MSSMEIEFWRFLCSDVVSLKQRIPEVALFRKCTMEAWFSSGKNGLMSKKLLPAKDYTTNLQSFLKTVLDAAEDRERKKKGITTGSSSSSSEPLVIASTPVAILRKVTAISGANDKQGCPVAIILTASELTSVIESISNKSFDDCDVYSIQSIVEPIEDSRIVSVYSCDLMGDERSDIFARTFQQVYPIHGGPIDIATPDSVALDRCQNLPPSRRQLVESKTLSLVRFARRFYDVALDGFIAEFIISKDTNQLTLHGFWSVTTYTGEQRSIPQDPDRKLKHRPPPAKAYPFPVDRPESLLDHHKVQLDPNSTSSHAVMIEQLKLKDAQKAKEKEAKSGSAASMADELIDRIVGRKKGQEPVIFLEVWDADDYLGECILPKLSTLEKSKGLITYSIGRPDPDKSRPDYRKTRFMNDSSVTLEMYWRGNQEPYENELRLLLSHGKLAVECSPKVQLWLKREEEFTPLWTSSVKQFTTNPQFKEQVDLKIEFAMDDGSKQQWLKTRAAAKGGKSTSGSGASRKRPVSAGPGGRHITGDSSVAGARLGQHWGVDAGSSGGSGSGGSGGVAVALSTHVLCNQILSRYQTERSNRCQMISVLARQLERFRDVQLSWQEQRMSARAAVSSAQQQVIEKEEEVKHLIREKEELVRDYKKRLEAMYRGVVRDLDEMRSQKVIAENKLSESIKREAEQTEMISRLEARNSALRMTLDRTMTKMNELTDGAPTLRDAEKSENTQQQNLQGSTAEDIQEIDRMQSEIRLLKKDNESLRVDLESQNSDYRQLQNEMRKEKERREKLEVFLKDVALKPE